MPATPTTPAEWLQHLSDTLGQGDGWFWEWVEINQQQEGLIVEWFRQASSEQMLRFWQTYYHAVLLRVQHEYEGYEEQPQDGEEDVPGFHPDEEELTDFFNWVIVQGKDLWALVAEEAQKSRSQSPSYDPRQLGALIRIWQSGEHAEAQWQGLRWQPRDGYFPGDLADMIHEERFGDTLWELG